MKTITVTRVPGPFIIEEWDSKTGEHRVVGFAKRGYRAGKAVESAIPKTAKGKKDSQVVNLTWEDRFMGINSNDINGVMLKVLDGERVE